MSLKSSLDSLDDDLISSTVNELSCPRVGSKLETTLDCLADIIVQDGTVEDERLKFCLNELEKNKNQKELKVNVQQKKQSCSSLIFGGMGEEVNFLKGLEDLLPDPNVMSGVVEEFFSKEVLGEPMQCLISAFVPWLQKFRETNPSSVELKRYEEQLAIYKEILSLCTEIGSTGSKTEFSPYSNRSTNGDFADAQLLRFKNLKQLVEKLEGLGEPPQELLDVLFAMTESSFAADENRENEKKHTQSPAESSHAPLKASEIEHILKSFQSLCLGGENEGSSSVNGGEGDTREHSECMEDDYVGFAKFLKGLGMEFSQADQFQELVKIASKKFDEDAMLDQMSTDPSIQKCQDSMAKSYICDERHISSALSDDDNDSISPLDPEETCRQQ